MNHAELIDKLISRATPDALSDAFEVCRELEMENAVIVQGHGKRDYGTTVYDDGNFSRAHEFSKRIRSEANGYIKRGVDADNMLDLYYRTHLFDAPHFFDSFCIYIEKDRAPEKQFYLPRRKQLLPCVDALQDLENGDIELLGICPEHCAPGIQCHHNDGIDAGMVLECLQGIDDHRLIVHMDELLGNILMHTGAAAGGSQQSYIHKFSPFII